MSPLYVSWRSGGCWVTAGRAAPGAKPGGAVPPPFGSEEISSRSARIVQDDAVGRVDGSRAEADRATDEIVVATRWQRLVEPVGAKKPLASHEQVRRLRHVPRERELLISPIVRLDESP